ncbi:MAG: GNAT family N-acetyltransferase [Bacteroidetes bacterium]|nr:GNAT family N-acetyltransferase [Bacteroidota bacterium]
MIKFRYAGINDSDLLLNWANDDFVRKNSFNQNKITITEHTSWLNTILNSATDLIYIFSNKDIPVGTVNIRLKNNETVIGISVDRTFRGKGYGALMLTLATNNYFDLKKIESIFAYIKKSNSGSIKTFLKANFTIGEELWINESECLRLFLTNGDQH